MQNPDDAAQLLDTLQDDSQFDLAGTLRRIVDWLRPDNPRNVAPVIARIAGPSPP